MLCLLLCIYECKERLYCFVCTKNKNLRKEKGEIEEIEEKMKKKGILIIPELKYS